MTDGPTTAPSTGSVSTSDPGGLDGFSHSTPAQTSTTAEPGQQQDGQQQPNPRARGHSPSQDLRDAQAGAVPGDRTIKIGGADYAERAVLDAIAAKAAEDSRRATLPNDPSAYQAKFTEDYREPVGLHFEFDEHNPETKLALDGARSFAQRHGLDQRAFSELLELHAATQFKTLAAQKTFVEGEIKKLGSGGPQRIDAVGAWLNQKVGPELAKVAMATMATAANVETYETIIKLFSSQGGASFTQTGREGEQERGKITGYSTMSFEQRRVAQLNGKR